MDQTKLSEYKKVVEKSGDKPIRAELAALEEQLGKNELHRKRLAEISKDLEAIPGQAEALGEASSSAVEVEALGRRLNELQSLMKINSTICAMADRRLENAWQSFEAAFIAWRAGESRKVIAGGLATFQESGGKAADLLIQLVATLLELEAKLEDISLPGDLAKLRGVRMAAELAGGVLLTAQGKPGIVVLPIANTGRESLNLHGRARTIREATPDPHAPMIGEASNWLALLSLERPEAWRPISRKQ